MRRTGEGIWSVETGDDGRLANFDGMVGTPYMYRITKDDGSLAYRTDIWSLTQIGAEDFHPDGAACHGSPAGLDGPQRCSVVCDPKRVTGKRYSIPMLGHIAAGCRRLWRKHQSHGRNAQCRAACVRRPSLSQAARRRASRFSKTAGYWCSAQANPTGRFCKLLPAP